MDINLLGDHLEKKKHTNGAFNLNPFTFAGYRKKKSYVPVQILTFRRLRNGARAFIFRAWATCGSTEFPFIIEE